MSTGHTDMGAANAIRATLDAKAADKKVHGPILEDCVKEYLASRRHELADGTAGQAELILNRLVAFAGGRSALFIRELTVDLVEKFKIHGLPYSDNSRRTYTAHVRCFLSEALRRGWINDPIALRVKPHSAQVEEKAPYSDDEVDKILAGCAGLSGGKGRYTSHPETFRLLLELMLETGMRVGDAARYDPSRVARGDKLWIYSFSPQKSHRAKRAKVADVYIGDGLKRKIDGCHWLSVKLPFSFGNSRDPAYLSHEVYDRLQSIGSRVGVVDCRSHRFRDTFAVRKLLRGVSLDDVSRLLGHSSVRITEMYYAKWIPARARRLERVVAESLMDPKSD